MTNRAAFPACGQELIGGSTYGPYIYVGYLIGTAAPVISASDPDVGCSGYCFSGTTTVEVCGETHINNSGQFCDDSGCTNNPNLVLSPVDAERECELALSIARAGRTPVVMAS